MNGRWLTYLLLLLPLTLGLSACSTKKNTAASRQYTAFITRYNVYFNGDEHYRQTLSEMEKSYTDDYSRPTLLMHPAEAYADPTAPQPSADFKRSIEKAQKAIQLRSITRRLRRPSGSSTAESRKWMKRDEYNPFLHNAWMLMGRSQYMNGDFLGAASTFHYVAKHFVWLPETVTEASLWRARSYLAAGWLFEAESILGSIKEKQLTNSTLRNLYDFDMANLLIRRKRYGDAIPYLTRAADNAKGAQKARLTFLLGQVYDLASQPAEAYRAFGKVAGMSGASHQTRFNARIKQSEVFQEGDTEREIKALKALSRYGSNSGYLDQIHYAIGNLYMARKDTADALVNYQRAVTESKRHGVDAALASLALGKIYFNRGQYELTQPAYSYAITRIPENYQDYDELRRKSDALDELALYARNVTLHDSLLKLSAMTPTEQRRVVDGIIARLEKAEKKQAEAQAREEYLARQQSTGISLDMTGVAAPSTFTLNSDKSWYFYNEASRNAGRVDFRRRWGNRKLEDDWRRSNKNTFASFNDIETAESAADEAGMQEETPPAVGDRKNDPHFPEYYLSQIPSTDAERAKSASVIQESLYNEALVLKDELSDYPAATRIFTKLLSDYPDNVYRLDTYYNLYLLGVLSNNNALAEDYRHKIINEFPASKEGEALKSPDYMEKLSRMPFIEDSLYQKAYDAYFANDNQTVHELYREASSHYSMSRNMPKFMFLEALSYITENRPEKFAETMQLITERYPDSDVAPLASSYLNLLAKGEKLVDGQGNLRGMQRPMSRPSTTGDTLSVLAQDEAMFGFRTDTAQMVLLVYDLDRISPRKVLFDVARHNFLSYSIRDFDLEQLQLGSRGVLLVSGFDNSDDANAYRARLETSTVINLPDEVMPIVMSLPDSELIRSGIYTIDDYLKVADEEFEPVYEETEP